MDLLFLLKSLKDIIFNPVKAWETIDSENKTLKSIRIDFLFPLFILVSLSAIAGSLLFSNTELPPAYSILTGLKTFLILYVTVYIASFIIKEITFPLDLGRDFSISFRIISFSLAPFLLCQVLSGFFESLLFVNVLGLYGLYIFWAGAEKLLDPPAYKKMPLLIASLITIMAVYIVSDIVFNLLTDKIFHAFFA